MTTEYGYGICELQNILFAPVKGSLIYDVRKKLKITTPSLHSNLQPSYLCLTIPLPCSIMGNHSWALKNHHRPPPRCFEIFLINFNSEINIFIVSLLKQTVITNLIDIIKLTGKRVFIT